MTYEMSDEAMELRRQNMMDLPLQILKVQVPFMDEVGHQLAAERFGITETEKLPRLRAIQRAIDEGLSIAEPPKKEDEKKEDQPPRLIAGLVLKVPGLEASVDYAFWFAPEGRLPAKESLLAYFNECLNVFYDTAQDDMPRVGGVRTVKDLVGDLFGLLPELPEGVNQRVRSDLGEPVALDSVYFDKFEPATDEYDEDGTDCVVVAPVT